MSRSWIADAPGLYLSAASKRHFRTTLIATGAFGNTCSNNSDASRFLIASCTTTQMSGFWAERVSLFVPGMMYKSVSSTGNGANVGARFKIFAASTATALAFTGVDELEAPETADKLEVDGLEAPKVVGELEAPEAANELEAPEAVDELEVPEAVDKSEAPKVADKSEASKVVDKLKASEMVDELEAPIVADWLEALEAPEMVDESEVPKAKNRLEALGAVNELEAPETSA